MRNGGCPVEDWGDLAIGPTWKEHVGTRRAPACPRGPLTVSNGPLQIPDSRLSRLQSDSGLSPFPHPTIHPSIHPLIPHPQPACIMCTPLGLSCQCTNDQPPSSPASHLGLYSTHQTLQRPLALTGPHRKLPFSRTRHMARELAHVSHDKDQALPASSLAQPTSDSTTPYSALCQPTSPGEGLDRLVLGDGDKPCRVPS